MHRRLADVALTDHVDALLALTGKHPDLDLSRVAVRGTGLGGWLAALAVTAPAGRLPLRRGPRPGDRLGVAAHRVRRALPGPAGRLAGRLRPPQPARGAAVAAPAAGDRPDGGARPHAAFPLTRERWRRTSATFTPAELLAATETSGRAHDRRSATHGRMHSSPGESSMQQRPSRLERSTSRSARRPTVELFDGSLYVTPRPLPRHQIDLQRARWRARSRRRRRRPARAGSGQRPAAARSDADPGSGHHRADRLRRAGRRRGRRAAGVRDRLAATPPPTRC